MGRWLEVSRQHEIIDTKVLGSVGGRCDLHRLLVQSTGSTFYGRGRRDFLPDGRFRHVSVPMAGLTAVSQRGFRAEPSVS